MKIKFAKVRITNRPPAAPVTGLDHLAASRKREAATHDKFIRDYTAEMLEAAFDDLEHRSAYDFKNSEHRWVMGRRAALVRKAQSMKGGRK